MRSKSSEKGHIVVTVAILLAAMLGFAALATDMGYLYSSRTRSQAIVDAAALSGAASFVFSPFAAQPATAENRAMAAAVAQSVLGDSVQASEVTVNVDLVSQLVTVTMDRPEETFFGNVLGISQARIRVTGIAEAALTASGSGCTKPWFLPNTILMDDGSCLGLNGAAKTDCMANLVCGACEPGNPMGEQLVAVYDSTLGRYATTQYARDLIAQHVTLNIRPTTPSDTMAPGQFYSLRLGDSTGGDDYRTNIATCASEDVGCGFCYDTEPGNMIGPTNQGVGELMPDPPDQLVDLGDGEYCFQTGSGPCQFNGSPQLVTAPIWDVCNTPGAGACPSEDFCVQDEDGNYSASFTGTPSLRVIAFATLFVTGWDNSGSNVQARLLGIEPCGAGGFGGTGGGTVVTGPLATPIRLVRTQ